MTEYESTFVGFNEIPGALPISGYSHLKPVLEDLWPQKDALISMEVPEKRKILARGKTHLELVEARIAAAEADEEEDEEEYGEEEGGDEEGEGEEGEGEGEEGEAEGEEEEEAGPLGNEEPELRTDPQIESYGGEDQYFMHGEKMRSKFNELEIDSFFKLLKIRPQQQWQDDSVHHYKMGIHTYEDDS